jgi:peptidyl-prolyl cis-trans isomerase D
MLRGIRNASSGWLGKTIMAAVVGFLVISFGIWGIGDIFRGYTRGALATVGSSKITGEQFRQLYQNRLQQLSRQVRRPITPEQARAFGLDRQVLGQWVQNAALDQLAHDRRLGISDADIVRQVTEDPAFRNPAGQFDAARFQEVARELGMTEQGYIADQRRETLRRQITSTLASEVQAPRAEAEAVNRYENEQRDADYMVLTRAQAGDIPAPSPDVLAKYFDERKVLFRAPEYRKATVVALTSETLAPSIKIAPDDVKAFYDQNIARFSLPEKRELEQILFPNQDDAHKAADRIASGELSFDDLAKERKLTPKDINLGLIPKSSIADQKVADAAFSLAPGKVSGAIDGAFGSTIVRVLKVEPGSTKSFDEVKGEIEKELALQQSRSTIAKMRDKIDELVGGGTPLEEIAKKLEIPYQTIDAIDRSGRDPQGKPVTLPKDVNVLDGIFSAEVGIENDVLQTPDGGLVWYDLVSVTPSRERPLDEVKDQVEARWRDDEVISRLEAKAKTMLDRIKGGTSFADVAAADRLTVEKTKWLKRRDNQSGLPAEAVAALFRTAKGEAGTADGKEPTERIVFRVDDVTIPNFDPNSPDGKQIMEALRNQIASDLYSQFVARLETDLNVSIDQNELAQAIGSSSQN